MSAARRVWAAVGVGFVLALALPGSAGAHALLEAAEPADGATLTASPGEIVLRFTEAPEPSLSSLVLLDSTGAELDVGEVRVGQGDPHSVSVTPPELARGVYTVTWRTVSQVDGHPSGGAFAFGVGVSPAGTEVIVPETPPASPLEMGGRLLIFLGLGLLIGAAWVGGIAFPESPDGIRRLATWAWVVSVLGLIVLAFAQQQSAEVGFGEFLPTKVGRALLYRGGAIVVAGTALFAARTWPSSRRRTLLIAGLAAAGAMLAHVIAGHAAARGDLAWAKVLGQWVHFAAAGVWLGGLAALLIGIRGEPGETKTTAIKRFSLIAGFALAAVVITGVIRSIQEIGDWGALFTTGYGIAVLVKAALILGLAGLGAVNRYRHVPAAATSLVGLRRISRGELTLAVAAVGAAAVLATLVPPAQVPAEAGPPPGISVSASDFARTVKLRLEVSPGAPGSNRFSLQADDYDSGEPIEAQRVALQFSFLGAAEVAPSTLELESDGDGGYIGTGSNLSIGGPWALSALVQQGSDSAEVPLEVATVCNALRIEGTKANEPTVSTVETPDGGSVEGYVIDLGQNRFEVHFTFITSDGKEADVDGLPSITAWQKGAPALSLEAIPLTQGHFLAQAQLGPGEWRFDGSAQSAEGSSSGCFEESVA
jgi:copper transport protein